VPTPGTLFALIVAEATGEAPAGALLQHRALLVLLVSIIPDLLLPVVGLYPGTTLPEVGIVMLMHLVTALLCVSMAPWVIDTHD
jgi:hypothetical protein